jgi:ATP-dependent Clp protease ATP-binding subunit ClpX
VASLEELDAGALVRILTEPRNSLIRQYERLLRHDQVELVVEEEALAAMADEAIARGTGARALRTIIEELMLDTMYEIPSRDDVLQCVISAETVRDKATPPRLVTGDRPSSDDDEEEKKTA